MSNFYRKKEKILKYTQKGLLSLILIIISLGSIVTGAVSASPKTVSAANSDISVSGTVVSPNGPTVTIDNLHFTLTNGDTIPTPVTSGAILAVKIDSMIVKNPVDGGEVLISLHRTDSAGGGIAFTGVIVSPFEVTDASGASIGTIESRATGIVYKPNAYAALLGEVTINNLSMPARFVATLSGACADGTYVTDTNTQTRIDGVNIGSEYTVLGRYARDFQPIPYGTVSGNPNPVNQGNQYTFLVNSYNYADSGIEALDITLSVNSTQENVSGTSIQALEFDYTICDWKYITIPSDLFIIQTTESTANFTINPNYDFTPYQYLRFQPRITTTIVNPTLTSFRAYMSGEMIENDGTVTEVPVNLLRISNHPTYGASGATSCPVTTAPAALSTSGNTHVTLYTKGDVINSTFTLTNTQLDSALNNPTTRFVLPLTYTDYNNDLKVFVNGVENTTLTPTLSGSILEVKGYIENLLPTDTVTFTFSNTVKTTDYATMVPPGTTRDIQISMTTFGVDCYPGVVASSTGTSTMQLNYPPATINFKKVDREDVSKALAGATFELQLTDGTVVDTQTSDSNGVVSFENLVGGDYVIVETAAPHGYTLDSTPYNVTVADGETRTISNVMNDQILPTLTADDVTIQQGDSFDPLSANNNLVGTWLVAGDLTSSVTVKSNNVDTNTPGTYTVVYTVTNEFGKTVDRTITVTVLQSYGNIVVTKVDSSTDLPLAGATFDLVDAAGAVVATSTTDAAGNVTFTNQPYGTYTITETMAPEGYAVDNASQTVTLSSSQVDVRFTNTEIMPVITADDVTIQQGKSFDPLNANNNLSATWLVERDLTSTITVKDSNVDTNVPGTYTVIYTVTNKFVRTAEHTITVTVLPSYGTLTVEKRDKETNALLTGAEFKITSLTTGYSETYTLDEFNALKLSELPIGEYIVEETRAPVGYMLDAAPQTFSITAHKQHVELVFYDTKMPDDMTDEEVLPDTGL